MAGDEIGFGVVGLGIGVSRCKMIKTADGARLVAVCDLDEERGRKAEAEFETEWIRDYDGPINIIEDVLGMLRDGKEPMVSGPEARKSVEIILAVYESAKRGEKIVLPLET